MTSDVPTQAERMPASSGKRDGNEKKKWEEKRELPSMANAAISASNVNELTSMAMRPTIAKTALRTLLPRRLLIVLRLSAEAAFSRCARQC